MRAIRRSHAILCCLFFAAPVSVAQADCRPDTTKSQPRTMFSGFPIEALHIDLASSSAIVNGETRAIEELRFALAFCKWPAYTLVGISAANNSEIQTSYVVPGSTYHPDLYLHWGGWELQRRWRKADIMHPMLTFGSGRGTAEYRYASRNADGIWEYHYEAKTSVTYVTSSVGVEASVFKYMTAYLLVGARVAGALETPGVNASALQGVYATFGFGYGKFR